ncbi:hypothetical protein EKO04_007223 [Ascochyta lentis]|uniref:Pyrroline-5-carboxylate reductase n=1 Tax=Ascochyta lentis TaxID=205686 RepID=A0A8H7J2S5_9PLEO|nr:hypothetical protein EKO04_007223 [Ascochyta lentis]
MGKYTTVAIIGCGALGTFIAAGIVDPTDKSNFAPQRLIATVSSESSKRRVTNSLSSKSVQVTVLLKQDNLQAIKEADVIILAIKPVKRPEIFGLAGVTEALRGKLIISIMAGISTTVLARQVTEGSGAEKNGQPLQIVRVMPNMAAKIREAMSLCTANLETLTEQNLEFTSWIFNQVGQSKFVDESTFDISAVLVGCAGSLLLLAVDGLLDAAVAEGVKRPEATEMVMQSAIGMMKLVPAGDHPSVLREKIASPGGCSIRALLELEKLGVRSAFTSAIMAAAEKSKSLSR